VEEPRQPPPPPAGGPASRRPSLPGRLIGGGARGAARVAGATGLDAAAERALEEAIVRAVESAAVERAVARVLQGPAVEEAVEEAMRSPAVERAALNALDSEMVERVWERLLASDEVQKLVERIAEAPEVRSALTAQGAGFFEDLARELRRIARRLDDGLERLVRAILRRPRRTDSTRDAGGVTRLLAFAVDAAILNAAFLGLAALVSYIASSLFDSGDASGPVVALGLGAWFAAGCAYLFVFWSLTSQTPGMRLLGIRLVDEGEAGLGPRVALRRLAGMVLAAVPLGLGFAGILLSGRRRGLHDLIAATEVVYVEERPRIAPWSEEQQDGPAPG
jgi:uncharacterized RDD family membrane protein YckC